MQNAYIVDFFLSGMLMIMMFYLYVDILSRLKLLNRVIDSNTLAVAIGQTLRQSVLLSMPLLILLMFLLWRFYAVMVISQSWGIGGAGLLVIMAILGSLFVWLDMLLVCIKNSRFVDASKLITQVKKTRSKIRLPDPNTPLSEVRIK
ncbi:hypothetical protein [Psychrobacter sanguinis]|uniref:hypothetical protein n=1 Tax=Psychrobacter sanguinis TaxID=861445 RepID=UPI0028AEB48A|nr:hypothetical protein [Psychrobacter sanguinis]